jgi:hypothetical protein
MKTAKVMGAMVADRHLSYAAPGYAAPDTFEWSLLYVVDGVLSMNIGCSGVWFQAQTLHLCLFGLRPKSFDLSIAGLICP